MDAGRVKQKGPACGTSQVEDLCGIDVAQFLETVSYDASTQRGTIGEPPRTLVAYFLRTKRRPNASTLLAGRRLVLTDEGGIAFYADSWALVHYMLNKRGEKAVEAARGEEARIRVEIQALKRTRRQVREDLLATVERYQRLLAAEGEPEGEAG